MTDIPISQITLSGWNPRKIFESEAFEELKKSIQEHGILEPLIIRPVKELRKDGFESKNITIGKPSKEWAETLNFDKLHPNLSELDLDGCRYELVAGERRFRAAQELGLEMVPVVIKNLSDRDVREIMLIENLQRSGLEPLEEAAALDALLQDDKITQEELGKKLGKSQAWIANRLRLLKAPDELKEMIISREISPKHVMALLPYTEYPVFKEVILPDFQKDIKLGKHIAVSELDKDIDRIIRWRSDDQVLQLHDLPCEYKDFFDLSKCEGCKDIYAPPVEEEEEPEECNTEKDEKGVCSHLWGKSCGVTCCRACSDEDCNSRCENSAQEIEEEDEKQEPERYCLNRRCWADKLNIAKQKYEKARAAKIKTSGKDDTVDIDALEYNEYERIGKWNPWDKTECQTCKSRKIPLKQEDYQQIEFVCMDPPCAKAKEQAHRKEELKQAQEEAKKAIAVLDAWIETKPTLSDIEVHGIIKILVCHLWGESVKAGLKPWDPKAKKWDVAAVDKIPDDDIAKALLRLVCMQELTAHNYHGINQKSVKKVMAIVEGKPLPKEV